MTEDPKTLRELNVKPGDVVRPYNAGKSSRLWPPKNYTIQPCGGIIDAGGDMWGGASTDLPDYPPYRRFTIVYRADVPKLWRDMTPEEKGALLLAHHDGKEIEAFWGSDLWDKIEPSWDEGCAYRVRPQPVRETVEQYWKTGKKGNFVPMQIGNGFQLVHKPTHRITFDLIDGKPDLSVKMEEISSGDNK